MVRDDDDTEDAKSVEGGVDAQVKIKRWVEPLLHGPEASGDLKCVLFLDAKVGEKEINDFIYERGKGESLDTFVGAIVSCAEDEALEYVKKVKFVVRAKGVVTKCRFDLIVPMRENSDDDEEVDELPTQRGQVHQAQRHVERMANIMVDCVRTTLGTLKQQLSEERERNNFLMRGQQESIIAAEQLRSMAFEREELREERKRKKDREERALKMAERALPVVAAKLLGGGAKMAQEISTDHPIDGALEKLIDKLETNPEMFAALQKDLDTVDLMNLGTIHQYVAKKKEARGEGPSGTGQAREEQEDVPPIQTPA